MFKFIFKSPYSVPFLVVFFLVFFLVILYENGVVQILDMDGEKKSIIISFPVKKWQITYEHMWLISGVCAVLGTIILSKLISFLIYPIIWLRYLYPSFIIVWLIFGICLSKLPGRKIFPILFSCAVIISCFPSYVNTVKEEVKIEKALNQTLKITREIGADDRIITDISHLDHIYETASNHYCWTVGEVYYPDTEIEMLSGTEIPKLSFDKSNWLFLSGEPSNEMLFQLRKQNCAVELLTGNGYVGTYQVYIYKVLKE